MQIVAYQLAMMAEDCYNDLGGQFAVRISSDTGWKREAGDASDRLSGFSACRYRKDGDVIVAYRGTSGVMDAVSDAQMVPLLRLGAASHALEQLLFTYGVGDLRTCVRIANTLADVALTRMTQQPTVQILGNSVPVVQTNQALQFFDQTFPRPIMVVGHSLGGALAKAVGDQRQVPSVGFNSPYMGGMRGMIPHTSMLETSIDASGDPLSLLTREVGNLPHGMVVPITIAPCPRRVPEAPAVIYRGQNCVLRSLDREGLAGFLGCKAVAGARYGMEMMGAEAVYMVELIGFLKEAALHFHSMGNLRTALSCNSLTVRSTN